MTYEINYTQKDGKVYCMFDIEYYMTKYDEGYEWFSEIHCVPMVEGLTYFLKDRLTENDFDYGQFVKDANDIQEIRGLLFERYDNRPKADRAAGYFHYHVFGDVLDRMLDDFCAKYNLSVNRD